MPELISRADALAQGLPRYFTGNSCPQGHIEERHVINGNCIGCSREAKRKWRHENPEANRKVNRKANRKYQSTPEGREAKRETDRKRRSTPEGRDADRKSKRKRAASISAKAKMRYLTRTTPLVRTILIAASFQPTDETRRTFALWLLDNPDSLIHQALSNYQVDYFLADYSGF